MFRKTAILVAVALIALIGRPMYAADDQVDVMSLVPDDAVIVLQVQ